ncbi:MAG: hypothetical protein Tsb0021_02260 [Chlamydiales bacterium]
MLKKLMFITAVLPFFAEGQLINRWYEDSSPETDRRIYPQEFSEEFLQEELDMDKQYKYQPQDERSFQPQGDYSLPSTYYPMPRNDTSMTRTYRADMTPQLNEKEVKNIIQQLLKNSDLMQRIKGLDITVINGMVVITGTVQTPDDLMKLNRLVNTIQNLQINTRVEVEKQGSSSNSTRSYRKEDSSSKSSSSSGLLALNGNSQNQSVSDQDIKRKIEKELKGGWFSSSYKNINIEINDGVVTVTGIVENTSDMKEVEDRIKNIKGVQMLKNNLVTKGSERQTLRDVSDQDIQKKIEMELQNTWWGNYGNVKVEVNNGTVILTGPVEDEGDIENIESRISEIPGVKIIRNRLTVKDKSNW